MKSKDHSQFEKVNKCKRVIFHPRFLGNTRKGIEEALKSERNLVSEDPTVGSTLTGVVHRVFKNHVSLLVYGIFNVSIRKSELNEDQLMEGNEVEFKVERIYVNNRILSMHGSLWSEEGSWEKKKTKRKSHIKFTDEPTAEEDSNLAVEGMEVDADIQGENGVTENASFNGLDETSEDVKMTADETSLRKSKENGCVAVFTNLMIMFTFRE
uniref:RPA43 OB domain-containing protein n=1 Tax=Magallana gigas TaxID=29159 RepID=K1PN01_MAGGI